MKHYDMELPIPDDEVIHTNSVVKKKPAMPDMPSLNVAEETTNHENVSSDRAKALDLDFLKMY